MLHGFKRRFKNYFGVSEKELRSFDRRLQGMQRELNVVKELIARQQIALVQSKGIVDNLAEVEFKVYSQSGEDGIIQYLINHVQELPLTFVEFGVENYQEANTRFLLANNNWSGLVIDGSEKNIQQVKADEFYVRFDLHAVAAFITKSNINQLISNAGFRGEIGILSIDVDGNDYWIWDAINVVNPVILICEYNSVFGNSRAISVPYSDDFYVRTAHYSNLYFGASLPALTYLANRKGYSYVGSNSNGSNAFFVRQDRVGDLKLHTAETSFVESKFRSSRNQEGKLSYVSGNKRIQLIAGMPVVNVVSGALETL